MIATRISAPPIVGVPAFEMALRPVRANPLSHLVLRQPADHVWTDDEGDRERGQCGEDRAQRQVAKTLAGMELRGPLGEIPEHQCAPPWLVVPLGAERRRDPLQPIDSRSLDEDGHALSPGSGGRDQLVCVGEPARAGAEGLHRMPRLRPHREQAQRRSPARTPRSRRAAARIAGRARHLAEHQPVLPGDRGQDLRPARTEPGFAL